MGSRVRSVCVVMVLAAPAAAQSTTEDGIRAMLRGDHQVAFRILRPLADDAAHPDPVAQFFLAVLYETGQGVRNDMGRACGLFLRSAAHAHPFAEQSAAIAANLQQQLGDGASMLCVANERWQGGPPLSFDLGPGHRIVCADTSVTVTHGEQEQRGLISRAIGSPWRPAGLARLRAAQTSITLRLRGGGCTGSFQPTLYTRRDVPPLHERSVPAELLRARPENLESRHDR